MTLEILPDSVYASLFKCWNRSIIVGKISSGTVVTLPAVSHYAGYLAFLIRYPLWIRLWTTGSWIWHLRIVRLKKTGPRETTSHDRRVLSGSAKVFWFERWKPRLSFSVCFSAIDWRADFVFSSSGMQVFLQRFFHSGCEADKRMFKVS